MSESNRVLLLIAAIAALFVIGTTGASELSCQRRYSQDPYSIQNKGNQGQLSRFDQEWLPCLVERGVSNLATKETFEEKEQRELIAQESVAIWAFWAVFFAGLTAVVTAIGTYFIAAQVKLTRRAVEENGKTIAAMDEANNLAGRALDEAAAKEFADRKEREETLRIQRKAYLGLLEAGVELTGTLPNVWVIVKNFGQTPAYDFRGGIRVYAKAWKANIEIAKDDVPSAPLNLAPGQGYRLAAPLKLEPRQQGAWNNGDLRIYVNVICTFRDAFGTDERVTLCLAQASASSLSPYDFTLVEV